MDLDKEFVRAVLKEGDSAYRLALEKGIGPERLFDEGKLAWDFCIKHKKQYGVLPSVELITGSVTAGNGDAIDLSAGLADGAAVLIDKVLERSVLNTIRDGAKQIIQKIEKRDAKEAVEAWSEIHRKLLKENLTVSKVESLFALGSKVIEYYEKVERGEKGIPLPWPTMMEQTMGLWPEDLALIVGRLGSGKTFTLLLMIMEAWRHNYKTLICSTEMAKEKLAARFLCLHFKIPYGDYRQGKLGEFVKIKMKEGITSLLSDQGIDIVGGDFDFSIDSLEAAVEESDPDMLAVDGAYLIKNAGKDRHERVSNTFDDLKRMSKRHKMATLANSQFNRSVKSGNEKTVSAENIGITDVAGWNADAAYGLNQSEDMQRNKIMQMIAMKVREGKPQDFNISWDMDRMDFSEIGQPIQGQPIAISQSSSVPSDQDDGSDIPF